MSKDVVLSVRISRQLNDKLGRLAKLSKRSKSWHVSAILADRVDDEAAYLVAIEEGLAAIRSGDLIDHEDVVARFERKIKAAARKRKRAA